MLVLLFGSGFGAFAQERQYLVAGKNDALPDDRAITAAGGRWVDQIPSIGVAIVKSSNSDFLTIIRTDRSVDDASTDMDVRNLETGEDAIELATAEEQLSQVAKQISATGVALGDPLAALQWAHIAMEIQSAHERGITGQGVIVAVLDTGIDRLHPDLVNSILPVGKSFAPRPCAESETPPCFEDPFFDGTTGIAHGTGMAGVIAATCNNGIGVCGIAPDAKILSVKIGTQQEFDQAGIPLSRLLQAYDYASSYPGVRIINASHVAQCQDTDETCRSQVVHVYKIANRMLALVYKRGVAFFAAAGNQGVNVSLDPGFRAWPGRDAPHVVTVGATTACGAALDGDVRNDFYDYHSTVANYGFDQNESRYLVMPGGSPQCFRDLACTVGTLTALCRQFDQVFTTTRRGSGLNGYTVVAQTSTATAHASGLAALILSRHPEYSVGQLVELMLSVTVVDVGAPGYDPFFGYGRGTASRIP
jgi:subtilisin family serine protease